MYPDLNEKVPGLLVREESKDEVLLEDFLLPSPRVAKEAAAEAASNTMTASFLPITLQNIVSLGWFIVYKNKDKNEYKTNRLSRTLVVH